MKILAIPYAGSSATTYYKFNNLLKLNTRIVPIEIPGRGIKSSEELQHSISGIVDSIYGEVLEEINDDEPYVVYGHSMGSLIAYELVYRLSFDEGVFNKPRKLFVSGSKSPTLRSNNEENYKLPLEKFKEKILSYGLTTSTEIFNDKKLLEFFIPIMRADFEAVEEYKYIEHKKLTVDLSVFWGIEDKSTKYEDIAEWGNLTEGIFSMNAFSGGHFFIFENSEEFIQKMIKELGYLYCL